MMERMKYDRHVPDLKPRVYYPTYDPYFETGEIEEPAGYGLAESLDEYLQRTRSCQPKNWNGRNER